MAKAKCFADESRKEIFNQILEDYQHKYCMAKYAINNQLLELNNVEIRITLTLEGWKRQLYQHHIINVERSKTEKEHTDKLYQLYATETGTNSLDCVMNEFRSANMFDWKVALTILNCIKLDVSYDKDEALTKIFKKNCRTL